jgi:hypothetical protein
MNKPVEAPRMRRIVVRKPGAVRLTAMCSQYGYCNCCCTGSAL